MFGSVDDKAYRLLEAIARAQLMTCMRRKSLGNTRSDGSTALPVTVPCGRGTDIAKPYIPLDKLPRPQAGFAEAATP